MKDKIGYCGIDCQKCDAYIATVNNDDALREKTAKLWSELNKTLITKEQINCLGCRFNGVKTEYCENMCLIRKCALNKNIKTCADCANMKTCKTLSIITSNNKDASNNLEEELENKH